MNNIFEKLASINSIEERKLYLESIGETEETLLEMAQIGVIDGSIIIKIYGAEGPVPHFHFYETQSKRDGCIKILEASYFPHGNKHLDTLKRWEVEDLIDWLCRKSEFFEKRGLNLTNWQAICILWDQNNPNYQLKNPNPEIPNYDKYL